MCILVLPASRDLVDLVDCFRLRRWLIFCRRGAALNSHLLPSLAPFAEICGCFFHLPVYSYCLRQGQSAFPPLTISTNASNSYILNCCYYSYCIFPIYSYCQMQNKCKYTLFFSFRRFFFAEPLFFSSSAIQNCCISLSLGSAIPFSRTTHAFGKVQPESKGQDGRGGTKACFS